MLPVIFRNVNDHNTLIVMLACAMYAGTIISHSTIRMDCAYTVILALNMRVVNPYQALKRKTRLQIQIRHHYRLDTIKVGYI